MKKLFTSLSAGFLLIMSSAFSQNLTFQISPTPITKDAGESFSVDVVANNFTNVLSFQYSINWNQSLIRFDSVGAGAANLPYFSLSSNLGTAPILVNNGQITVSWLDDDYVGKSLPPNSSIFKIYFTAISGPATNISITGNPSPIEILDPSGNPITHSLINGVVNINGGSNSGPGVGPVVFISESTDVNEGDHFCIDVSVENFNAMEAAQLTIEWDTAIVRFDSVTNLNLAYLASSNFGTAQINRGQLNFNWENDSGNPTGVTVINGTAIFQICFTAKKTGATDVDFTGNSTSIEIIRIGTNGMNEGLVNNAGTINVSGGPITDFYQWAAKLNAPAGSTVCVPVRTLNFDDILLFQYSLHFDPSILTYDTVRFDSTLIGMSTGDFGLTDIANGTITVRWFDENVNGITIADSTVLYELCFTVNGTNGQFSDISFNGTPTGIEAGNGAGDPIPILFGKGRVTVGTAAPPTAPPLKIRASSPSVDQGQNVCVDITVQDFTKITDLDYTLNWNPAVLTYQSVQSLNLTGLVNGNFTANQTNGTLALSWDAPGGTGITKNANDRIYQACFTASGAAGATSDIDFVNTPTAIFVKNEAGDTLGFTKTKGKVTINQPVQNCGTVPGFAIYAENLNIIEGDSACVRVMVQQFTNVASFQWSMLYNPNKVRFMRARNFGLAGLEASNFQNTVPGEININWEEPNFNPTSKPDCAVIFELCFQAVGAVDARDTIKFSNTPVPFEFTDGNNILPNPTFVNGTVVIKPKVTTTPDIVLVGVTKRVECKGSSTGAINLNVTGGTGTFTYAWSPGNASTKDLTGIPAGVYTVTITSGTQTMIDTFTVEEPANPLTLVVDQRTDVKCFGDNLGAIELVANGGWGMYTIRWNPSTLPDDLSVDSLAAGSYAATITDGGGCQTNVGPIVIAGPSRALSITGSVIRDVDCSGRSNGSISITPIGGTQLSGGAYLYNWSPSPPANPSAKDQTNLSPGTYFVTVTDANQCTFSRSYTVSTVDPITVNQVITDANGSPNGSINITVTGGIPVVPPPGQGYTFSWRGPGMPAFTSSSEDILGLVPGTYQLTVTDAVNCSVSLNFVVGGTIDPPLAFNNVLVTKTCPGESTGSIRVFTMGGRTPITYAWSGPGVAGRTSNELFNLAEGTYTVTVTDGGGAQISRVIAVEAHPTVLISAGTIIPERGNPGTNNGSISINVSGGVGPFTYLWTPGNFNTKDINGLGAGNYSVVVTDQGSSCQFSASFNVGIEAPVSVSSTKSDISCPGATDGQFTLNMTGKPNFTITVNGNNPIITGNLTYTLTGLAAGNYNITVTDANGTSASVQVIINSPQPFTDIATVQPRTSSTLGQINLTVTGGTGIYNYIWSNGTTSEDLFNLSEGCYRATVTDSKGCRFVTQEYCITLFQIISVDVDSVKCANERNGRIAITADGGNEPYSYEWRREGSATIIDRDSILENQSAGRYIVRIIGSAGTVLEASYIIGSQSNIAANAIPVTNFGGFNVSCFDASNGRAQVSATGGKNPYSFNWEDGQTGPQAINLAGGIYEVTVTDALGCSFTTQVELRSPDEIQSNATVTDVSCSDRKDGRIQLTVTGGVQKVGTPKYDYQWNQPGLSGATVQFLGAGTYIVTISDANGCEKVETLVVSKPANSLKVEVITTEDNGLADGTAIAIVSGGTQPYGLNWNTDGPDSAEFEIRNLTPGLYVVVVTDAKGCQASGSGEVKDRRIECLSTRTVMTPDGDGLNEEFIIYCLEDYGDNSLEIYNRWGQLVFSAENYDNTWAGTTQRGADLPEGAYFFVFQYRDFNNKLQQLKGSFTILRE